MIFPRFRCLVLIISCLPALLCSEAQAQQVNAHCPEGMSTTICRRADSVLATLQQTVRRCRKQDPFLCSPPKGGEEPGLKLKYPYGKIISNLDRLSIQWSPVPDGSYYLVKLQGEGVNVHEWAATPSFTSGELQSGSTYLLTVIAYNRNGQKIGVTQQVFNTLPRNSLYELHSLISQLREKEPRDPAATLAISTVYLSYGLVDQAIQTLEVQQNKNPAMHCMLGDLYSAVGATDLAQQHYQQALSSASTTTDWDIVAKAQQGLASLIK